MPWITWAITTLNCHSNFLRALRDYLILTTNMNTFKLVKVLRIFLLRLGEGFFLSHSITLDATTKSKSINVFIIINRKEKPNVALFYLNQSLELEMLDPRSEQLNLAGTHLNLTAILTKLGKHNEAITHAKSSIIILRRLIDRKEF